jgi:DNA polymerase elongation subunit (family B)
MLNLCQVIFQFVLFPRVYYLIDFYLTEMLACLCQIPLDTSTYYPVDDYFSLPLPQSLQPPIPTYKSVKALCKLKKSFSLDIDNVTRNGEAVIRLFGKVIGESDQNHIIVLDKSFRPYIYIIPSNTSDIGACTRDLSELGLFGVEKVFRNDMGESKGVLKITLKHPRNIPKLRDKIRNLASVKEVREYDIPFYRRYLIDKGLSPMNVVQVEGKVLSAKSSTCVFQLENPPTTLEYSLPKLSFLSFDIEVYSPHGACPSQTKIPLS